MSAKDSESRLGRLKAIQAKRQNPPADFDPMPAGGNDDGKRSGLMQRLREHLKGDDGKIDPQKAKQFLLFVKKQSADPDAPRHEMAKRIAEKLKNLPQAQRQRIMSIAGMGGASGGASGGGFGGGFGGGGAGKGAGAGAGARRAAGRANPVKQQTISEEDWFDGLEDKF